MAQKAIILAAGVGKRLSSLTRGEPKCLLKVNNKTILEYQVGALKKCGIRNITIVTGYEANKIEKTLGPSIKYIYNPFYATTGSLVSLWFAEKEMKNGFIYLHADVLFHRHVLKKLLRIEDDICLTVDRKNCVAEDMKVKVNGDNITEITKSMETSQAYGEFVGLAKFSKKGAEKLAAMLEKIMREGKLTEYFEYAVQRLIDDGHQIYKCDVEGLPWVEIDFDEDFKKAKTVVYPKIRDS